MIFHVYENNVFRTKQFKGIERHYAEIVRRRLSREVHSEPVEQARERQGIVTVCVIFPKHDVFKQILFHACGLEVLEHFVYVGRQRGG